jgi:hypothetical protein
VPVLFEDDNSLPRACERRSSEAHALVEQPVVWRPVQFSARPLDLRIIRKRKPGTALRNGRRGARARSQAGPCSSKQAGLWGSLELVGTVFGRTTLPRIIGARGGRLCVRRSSRWQNNSVAGFLASSVVTSEMPTPAALPACTRDAAAWISKGRASWAWQGAGRVPHLRATRLSSPDLPGTHDGPANCGGGGGWGGNSVRPRCV